ncbi:MAG: WYL domain-containing protein [Chitinophagales bacterium]|nr:WYL domain-containing protein [Chitinophagales bacterium]
MKDLKPREDVLYVLRLLMERPFFYKKETLATKINKSKDTITRIFDILRNQHFEIEMDKNFTYALKENKVFEYLKEQLYFTEKEREQIKEAIGKANLDIKRQQHILHKLENIYDISRWNKLFFNPSFLTKLNLLEQAKKEKRSVLLNEYHSTNSGRISDRKVEGYHIMIKEDLLQAYDLEARAIRHFKLSRIGSVSLTAEPWSHETLHRIIPTDPFGIVEQQQCDVTIRMKIGGYNELTERFPLTLNHITREDQTDTYVLKCKANHTYLGLISFLLGYSHFIIDIKEEHLKRALQEKINEIKLSTIANSA